MIVYCKRVAILQPCMLSSRMSQEFVASRVRTSSPINMIKVFLTKTTLHRGMEFY